MWAGIAFLLFLIATILYAIKKDWDQALVSAGLAALALHQCWPVAIAGRRTVVTS